MLALTHFAEPVQMDYLINKGKNLPEWLSLHQVKGRNC